MEERKPGERRNLKWLQQVAAKRQGVSDKQLTERRIRQYVTDGLLMPAEGRTRSASYTESHVLRLRWLVEFKEQRFEDVPSLPRMSVEEARQRLRLMTDAEVRAQLDQADAARHGQREVPGRKPGRGDPSELRDLDHALSLPSLLLSDASRLHGFGSFNVVARQAAPSAPALSEPLLGMKRAYRVGRALREQPHATGAGMPHETSAERLARALVEEMGALVRGRGAVDALLRHLTPALPYAPPHPLSEAFARCRLADQGVMPPGKGLGSSRAFTHLLAVSVWSKLGAIATEYQDGVARCDELRAALLDEERAPTPGGLELPVRYRRALEALVAYALLHAPRDFVDRVEDLRALVGLAPPRDDKGHPGVLAHFAWGDDVRGLVGWLHGLGSPLDAGSPARTFAATCREFARFARVEATQDLPAADPRWEGAWDAPYLRGRKLELE